jgi:hypothetical protein
MNETSDEALMASLCRGDQEALPLNRVGEATNLVANPFSSPTSRLILIIPRRLLRCAGIVARLDSGLSKALTPSTFDRFSDHQTKKYCLRTESSTISAAIPWLMGVVKAVATYSPD